jgi:hypothetical protein
MNGRAGFDRPDFAAATLYDDRDRTESSLAASHHKQWHDVHIESGCIAR